MAGLPWIKVWTAVRDHPKVQRLERELGIKDGLGVVVRLWCWTADYHPGGEFPEADGVTAAKAARGDATKRSPADVLDAMVAAGLLDRVPGGLRVHDWDDMQTRHVEAEDRRKALAAERQARWRDRHSVTSNGSRNASRNGDVTDPIVTEREREREKERETENNPSPCPPVSVLPLGAGGGERTRLGPLGSELRKRVEEGIGHGLGPCTQARADVLEAAIEAHGGVDAAHAFIASTYRTGKSEPRTVGWLAEVLAPDSEARQ